jgi:hypothetical protein
MGPEPRGSAACAGEPAMSNGSVAIEGDIFIEELPVQRMQPAAQ